LNPAVDIAAHTVLAALGLCAATLAAEQGYDLRSRCLLAPDGPLAWEVIGGPGGPTVTYLLTGDQAIANLNLAVQAAIATGLPWRSEPLVLRPADKLVELVRRSRALTGVPTPEVA
jgi:CRISPR-associated protein Csb1